MWYLRTCWEWVGGGRGACVGMEPGVQCGKPAGGQRSYRMGGSAFLAAGCRDTGIAWSHIGLCWEFIIVFAWRFCVGFVGSRCEGTEGCEGLTLLG